MIDYKVIAELEGSRRVGDVPDEEKEEKMVTLWVSQDNAAILKALHRRMRKNKIVNVIFEGEA